MVVLTAVAGLLVFRQGWITAHMTETDVINHYADRYVSEHGGRKTDCHAVPGAVAEVWLEVRCGGVVIYPVDRAGRLLRRDPSEPTT